MNATMTRPVLLTAIHVLAGAFAQLPLKVDINSAGAKHPAYGPKSAALYYIGQLLQSPAVSAALSVCAGGLVVRMMALSRLPSSFGHSFQALTYVLVPLGSMRLLGESVSLLCWVGIPAISFGVLSVAASQ